MLRPAEAESSGQVLAKLLMIGASRALRIFPCDGLQDNASIGDAARDRSRVIEADRERHNAGNAYQSKCGLQSYDSAQSRGDTN